MKSANDGGYRFMACFKYVFQTVVCTTSKQQPIGIESHLMSKIVVDVFAITVLHIEVVVSLRNVMCFLNVCYYFYTFCNSLGCIWADNPFLWYAIPFCGYAV